MEATDSKLSKQRNQNVSLTEMEPKTHQYSYQNLLHPILGEGFNIFRVINIDHIIKTNLFYFQPIRILKEL